MNPRPRKWLAVVALCAASCASPNTAYIAADQATFDAVAPVYARYTQADATLSQADKDRRQRIIDTWKQRLDAAKAGSK